MFSLFSDFSCGQEDRARYARLFRCGVLWPSLVLCLGLESHFTTCKFKLWMQMRPQHWKWICNWLVQSPFYMLITYCFILLFPTLGTRTTAVQLTQKCECPTRCPEPDYFAAIAETHSDWQSLEYNKRLALSGLVFVLSGAVFISRMREMVRPCWACAKYPLPWQKAEFCVFVPLEDVCPFDVFAVLIARRSTRVTQMRSYGRNKVSFFFWSTTGNQYICRVVFLSRWMVIWHLEFPCLIQMPLGHSASCPVFLVEGVLHRQAEGMSFRNFPPLTKVTCEGKRFCQDCVACCNRGMPTWHELSLGLWALQGCLFFVWFACSIWLKSRIVTFLQVLS